MYDVSAVFQADNDSVCSNHAASRLAKPMTRAAQEE